MASPLNEVITFGLVELSRSRKRGLASSISFEVFCNRVEFAEDPLLPMRVQSTFIFQLLSVLRIRFLPNPSQQQLD